jgi:hypothetical protein
MDPERAARRRAIREFRESVPKRGSFHELERSGLVNYYDKRFGSFDPELDKWEEGKANVLCANPLLRRIDIIADALFRAGQYELRKIGDVMSPEGPIEGTIAVITMKSRARNMIGGLTIDIGGEVRFSKLRLYADNTEGVVVRLSTLDQGMAVQPYLPERRGMPETIHERAGEGSEIFRTLSETLAGLERLLRGRISG